MYNTGNPLGSTAPKDFSDNAEITDRYVNDVVNETTQDRFGRQRLTIHGQQERARRSFEQFESDADNVIANLGFFPPVDYTTGLNVDSRNFTVTYNGVVYAAQPSALPFTTGAWDAAQWYPLQNVLNQKNLLVFDTYAEASAAAATLRDGQLVVSDGDEVRGVVNSGAITQEQSVYKVADYAKVRGYTGRGTRLRVVDQTGAHWWVRRGAVADNGGTVLVDAQGRSWEREFSGAVNVKWFGALGDDTTDDYAALTSAIEYVKNLSGSSAFNETYSSRGAALYVPKGNYLTSRKLSFGTVAVRFYGDGSNTSIIKATAPLFNGSSILEFGSVESIAYTRNQVAESIGINCNKQSVPAIRFAGLRDGSAFRDIFITAFKGTAFQSLWSGDVSNRTMNQGVHIENVHAITQENIAGVSVYKFDGLYESNIVGCKALGFGSSDNTGARGFHFGADYSGVSCRGVNLIGCSAGNLKGSVVTGTSTGVFVENAEYVFTKGCTYESIDGYGIQYGSENASPSYCNSSRDRFYNPGTSTELKCIKIHSGSYNSADLSLPMASIADSIVIESAALYSKIYVQTNSDPSTSGGFKVSGATNVISGIGLRGEFSLSGETKFPAVSRSGMFGCKRYSIADDSYTKVFDLPAMTSARHSVLVISTSSTSVYAIVLCIAGGLSSPILISGGANFDVSNAAPSGTTGSDGKATLFINSSDPNAVFIENRRGQTLHFSVTALGAVN